MKQIYLDHAATSMPKAPGVSAAMVEYLEQVGVSINRSMYQPAQKAAMTTLALRSKLADFFGMQDPCCVALTPGNTWGLNQILWGTLKLGDRCLVSGLEHNAVMRVLHLLQKQGVQVDYIESDATGKISLEDARRKLCLKCRLVMVAHASNVSGTIQPVEELAQLCKEAGVALCLDLAQTAGHIPVQMDAWGIAAASLPAHKGMRGPQGIGALLVQRQFAQQMDIWVAGGTGSHSDEMEMPHYLPDRLEPGTPNLPGIYGWNAAMDWWQGQSMEQLRQQEQELNARFLQGLSDCDGIRVLGPDDPEQRVGVFSVDFLNRDNAEMALTLERDWGILTRCGLHCAPQAHRALASFPGGAVRFSFLPGVTRLEEVDRAVQAIRQLAR